LGGKTLRKASGLEGLSYRLGITDLCNWETTEADGL
jgi:hypothetical protein